MSDLELLCRVAAYLVSGYSLALGAWALAELMLPDLAPLGVRLLCIVTGQLVLTAILVQSLGLAGLLAAPVYFGASLLPGLAAHFFLRWRWPHRSLFRLAGNALRLWVAAPAWGLGFLGAGFVAFLAGRFLKLSEDIDALSLHGPMIVEWVQRGRVGLESHWNYPQCWEYQFVPGFLLLKSDLLSVLPSLLAIAALLLAVRVLAAELRLPGLAGHCLAFFAASLTVIWRDNFKNDTAFAVALLLGILALRRASRGLGGSLWPLQLSLFLVLGLKPSGFVYAAALVAAYLFVFRARRDPAAPRAGSRFRLALLALLVQASAAAVQLHNFWRNGNPIHPVRLAIAGFEIFPGPAGVAGTSILEHLKFARTWQEALAGGRLVAGAEWPALALLFVAALLVAAGRGLRLLAARRLPGAAAFVLLLPWIAAALWVLFAATPWSCGYHFQSWDYLASGNSFRYALAPLCLTYLTVARLLQELLGGRRLALALAMGAPLSITWKWRGLGLWESHGAATAVFAAWLLAGALALVARRAWPLLAGSRPRRRRSAALLALALLALAFFYARRVAANRAEFWMPTYREAWTRLWREAPSGATIAVNQTRMRYRYWMYGPYFDNRIVELQIFKGGGGRIPDEVDRLYVVPVGDGDLDSLLAGLAGRGWQVEARAADGSGALLARRPAAGGAP